MVIEKYYLALKALLAAHSISPSYPAVHTACIAFRHNFPSLSSNSDFAQLSLLSTSHLPKPFNTASLTTSDLRNVNNDFLAHASTLPHILAYVRAARVLDSSRDTRDGSTITILTSIEEVEGLTLEQGLEGLACMREIGSPKSEKEAFVEWVVDKLGGLGRGMLEREIGE